VAEAGPLPAGDSGTESALKFSSCPGAYTGACATVDMPLDWSDSGGAKIQVLINKIAVSGSRPKRQLWLLQGGPGASSAPLGFLGIEIAKRIPDTEVFAIEHRGVGGSNRIACPVFEAAHPKTLLPTFEADGGSSNEDDVDTRPCLAEVKTKHAADLRFYTTTNASRDLIRAIELTRRSGTLAFVYGASYGTYWAQRFLQVADANLVAGVVLDSIVPMSGQSLSQFDLQGDSAARKIAELCKTNATCSGALGPDPFARLQAARQKLAAGHCPESGLTLRRRSRLTQLLQIRPLIGYAFAIWHRFDRCTPEDAAAIRSFLSKDILPDANAALGSPGLYSNIAFSELWESPTPSDAIFKERADTAVFLSGIADLAPEHAGWPRYTESLAGAYPTTSTPMLMLAGELDAQTPFATQSLVKSHYTSPNQTFVGFPLGSHGIVGGSPLPSANPAAAPDDCGFNLLNAFITDPRAATTPLDVSCAAAIAGLDWKRPKEETSFVLGTTDLWLGLGSLGGDFFAAPNTKNLGRASWFPLLDAR